MVDFFIDQLTTDTSGQLWLTNSTGLACYNANDDRFTNYNLSNNGLDPSGNPLIYFSPNTQRLYIAQPKSILYIENPLLFNQKSPEDSLRIFQVDVLNKNGQIRWDEKHDLKLAHHQNFINLEYALINYTLSSETIYSWFLEGFDRDWSSSNSNIVKYNNLPPGDYILHLKAANSFGKWCTPKHLKLSIRPPFYKTYWFILLSVALLGASIYFLVQLRINRIREKYQLRNKIASDLHDEIGSTLTSINILSNVSQQAIEKQPKQALEMLEQISKQSKTIQQNMSDIVWSIRPDNEKIDDLFIRMREYAAHTLEPLNFKITFHFDQQLAAKSFPLLYRKDVLLIYKEAINNIVKHAQATEVEIEFSKKGKIITLTIHDNGVWKNNNAGTGTKTMQERAKAIGGHLELIKKESGTTVILNVPIP